MTPEDLIAKVKEVATGITNVKDMYVDESDLELVYITLFSHTKEEHVDHINAANQIGSEISDHNGPVFKLDDPIELPNGMLKQFRIRKPDPERPQKGCGDFKVNNYQDFKNTYIDQPNFVFFDRETYEFIGIHDLDQEYLVYFPDERTFINT